MVKNDILDLSIDGLTSECNGVGRASGLAVFVENTLPGDVAKVKIVNVKKNYAYGRAIRLMKPSPDRVSPPCPVFPKCGGCSLQHASYEAQLRLKRQKVKDAMERIGGFKGLEVNEAIGMEDPLHYRNKALYPIGGVPESPKIGFYERNSHEIVPADSCLIQSKACEPALAAIKEYIESYGISIYSEETHEGLLRHALIRVGQDAAGEPEVMVCLVVNGQTLPGLLPLKSILIKMVPNLKSIVINRNTKHANTILGSDNKVIWGSGSVRQKLGDFVFEISPMSFFQVNTLQAKALFDVVMDFASLSGSETVLDLHCGAGAISLFLARQAGKVIGIEIGEEAVKDAEKNKASNRVENVEFIAGSAESALTALIGKGMKADLIVADPPRKGCEPETISAILEISPPKIVFVSCDPATLARDCKLLAEGGYGVRKVQPVDMFPMTSHVETVALLEKQAPQLL